MKNLKALAVIVALSALAFTGDGCAQFRTTQSSADSVGDDGVPVRTVTTDATAVSFLAGKQALAGWKALQTGTEQGASIGKLDQESDASALVQAIISAYLAGQTGGIMPQTKQSAPLMQPK